VVPSSWPLTYKHVFGHGNSAVRIAIHDPAPLQEVFMTAFSIHAYELAKISMASLAEWFSNNQKILRCGANYTLYPLRLPGIVLPHREYLYRLDMSMPVLQGYVKPGFTNFVVTLAMSSAEGTEPKPSTTPNASDFVEIDEGFLRSSMLRVPTPPYEWKSSLKRSPVESTTSSNWFLPRPWSTYLSWVGDDATFYVCTLDLVGLGVLDGDWVRG
jgi:peroxin-6